MGGFNLRARGLQLASPLTAGCHRNWLLMQSRLKITAVFSLLGLAQGKLDKCSTVIQERVVEYQWYKAP